MNRRVLALALGAIALAGCAKTVVPGVSSDVALALARTQHPLGNVSYVLAGEHTAPDGRAIFWRFGFEDAPEVNHTDANVTTRAIVGVVAHAGGVKYERTFLDVRHAVDGPYPTLANTTLMMADVRATVPDPGWTTATWRFGAFACADGGPGWALILAEASGATTRRAFTPEGAPCPPSDAA